MTLTQRYAALTFGQPHVAGARNPVGASNATQRASGVSAYYQAPPAATSRNLTLLGVG